LPGRGANLGLRFEKGAAELLAERVEGNLLAAQQEIEKLALLHKDGVVSIDAVQNAVANSARYDVFQLADAALAGDAPRSLRILEGLRAEGAEPPLVLWALCRDLRALADIRNGVAKRAYSVAAERHAALVERAARRIGREPIEPWFEAAARIDRQVKGQATGEAWTTLTGLVAALSGARLPVAMPRS